MKNKQKSPPPEKAPAARGPLWQALYRWHFAAGLLLMPFFVLLAVTGVIYLYKPQIEPRLYKAYWFVAPGTKAQSADRQKAAAAAAVDEGKVQSYQYRLATDEAAQFSVKDKGGDKWRVWVDPYTAQVTGKLQEKSMLMQLMHDLHGQILLDKPGAYIMDLVAAWGIVLVLTGFFVWWPKGVGAAGVFWPRFGAKGRNFWRDLHAVPAAYSFLIILGFLFTGLAWTEVTGANLKWLAKVTDSGSPPSGFGPSPFKVEAKAGQKELSLDKLAALSKERLPGAEPWIKLATKPGQAAIIHYKSPKPQDRAYIHVNPYSGEVLGDFRWKDHGVIGKYTAMSVSLHEGTWFGAWNLALNTFTALMVILLVVTAFIMWWKRRPQGSLGLPPAPKGWRWPWWLWILALFFGAAMPSLGVSLLALFLVSKAL